MTPRYKALEGPDALQMALASCDVRLAVINGPTCDAVNRHPHSPGALQHRDNDQQHHAQPVNRFFRARVLASSGAMKPNSSASAQCRTAASRARRRALDRGRPRAARNSATGSQSTATARNSLRCGTLIAPRLSVLLRRGSGARLGRSSA